MTTGEWPTVRHAARVVLLDENGRVLLARFEYGRRVWWAAPGGGLELAETHEEAARREVREETGLKKPMYCADFGGGRSPSLKIRRMSWHRRTYPRWRGSLSTTVLHKNRSR